LGENSGQDARCFKRKKTGEGRERSDKKFGFVHFEVRKEKKKKKGGKGEKLETKKWHEIGVDKNCQNEPPGLLRPHGGGRTRKRGRRKRKRGPNIGPEKLTTCQEDWGRKRRKGRSYLKNSPFLLPGKKDSIYGNEGWTRPSLDNDIDGKDQKGRKRRYLSCLATTKQQETGNHN